MTALAPLAAGWLDLAEPTRAVQVIAPTEAPARRQAAAAAWVAQAERVGQRLGPAAQAQLTAYPAVAAWWGTAAAEHALPAPW